MKTVLLLLAGVVAIVVIVSSYSSVFGLEPTDKEEKAYQKIESALNKHDDLNILITVEGTDVEVILKSVEEHYWGERLFRTFSFILALGVIAHSVVNILRKRKEKNT